MRRKGLAPVCADFLVAGPDAVERRQSTDVPDGLNPAHQPRILGQETAEECGETELAPQPGAVVWVAQQCNKYGSCEGESDDGVEV
eukprot:CAMPEP_0117459984 /NCGR_PEP_ID=MMETSP0784-20121206/1764_1 /TAXON_ID=39447 /ORGANISM="" /LENGTH=85 /DNA_ID=CAMNT_0005253623 /DNA_START=174 /DNA_END=431 /DNA_ORIENTATION=-